MKVVLKFIKNWMLIISIIAGVLGYFIYVNIPFLDCTHAFVNKTISIIQPALIFVMLFLTFCKVNPRKIKPCKWHLWLLLIQAVSFTLIGIILILLPQSNLRVVLEGAMICLICPTATAGAVITRKLGGSVNRITTYTILINIINAILIPILVPYVHPNPDLNILNASLLILGKVFPLLLAPLIAALLLRYLSPRLHFMFSHMQELSFYLWAVALALAIAVTTKSIVHSEVSVMTELWLVIVSFLCCVLQFYFGKKIGRKYGDTITAGQSLGQKNTVLAIWMGYTFFSPVTAIVGGFYSIWHNVINSIQLYQYRKAQEQKGK